MNSFVFDIGGKARAASRFIGQVRHELQEALLVEKTERKLTQQQLATTLGVNRSVINRQIMGEENMTLRSVAELAWALGYRLRLVLDKPEAQRGQNYQVATTSTTDTRDLTTVKGPFVATATSARSSKAAA